MQNHPLVAVSLKLYFSVERTREYCQAIKAAADTNIAIDTNQVEVAIFPSFLAIPSVADLLRGTPIGLGAQNICAVESGAHTGEVSIHDVAALGCKYVEVGHAERKVIYKENATTIREKTQLTLRHGLIPLLCIGEAERTGARQAADTCIAQVLDATKGGTDKEICLGYEPHWAIGASRPAPVEYIAEVCSHIRGNLSPDIPKLRLLYGGSAGPGLLTQLYDSVDGLFLGRFAHDSSQFLSVVNEAATIRAER